MEKRDGPRFRCFAFAFAFSPSLAWPLLYQVVTSPLLPALHRAVAPCHVLGVCVLREWPCYSRLQPYVFPPQYLQISLKTYSIRAGSLLSGSPFYPKVQTGQEGVCASLSVVHQHYCRPFLHFSLHCGEKAQNCVFQRTVS